MDPDSDEAQEDPAMRKALLILLLFFSGAPLYADLPEGCREEAVQGSVPDGIELSSCHRYICSGNFWGDSAVDVCCAEGDAVVRSTGLAEIHYARCKVRHPTMENSTEPWFDLDLPLGFVETEEASSSLFDEFLSPLVLPSAFAIEDTQLGGREPRPPDPNEWRAEEKEAAAVLLLSVASRIREAFDNERTGEIGAYGTEFRQYSEIAYAVALWTVGYLAGNFEGVRESYCPAELPQCCFNASNLHLTWADQRGLEPHSDTTDTLFNALHLAEAARFAAHAAARGIIVAAGGAAGVGVIAIKLAALEVAYYVVRAVVGADATIKVDNFFRINEYPERIGGAILVLAGESLAYLLNNAGTVWLAPVSTGGVNRPLYTQVSTQWIVMSIINHFLPESVSDPSIDTEMIEALFQSLQTDTQNAREMAAQLAGGCEAVADDLSFREQVRQSMAQIPATQAVEDQFQQEGGLYGALGEFLDSCGQDGSGGDPMMPGATDPCNNHNDPGNECEAGTAGEGEEGELSGEQELEPLCEPPDCEGDPEECEEDPGDNDDDENDPDYGDDDNLPVPDCVAFANDEISRGRGDQIDTDCYNWCWDHVSPGTDGGGICGQLFGRDLGASCTITSHARCVQDLPFYCEYAHSRPEICAGLCDQNPDMPYCSRACGSEWDDYCDRLCDENRNQQFCWDACGRGDRGAGFCDDYCEDSVTNPPEFCGDYCNRASYQDETFCYNYCLRHPEHESCSGVCRETTDGGSRAYDQGLCDQVCETEANRSDPDCGEYIRDRERRAEEEARRREETDGCPGGWRNDYGILARDVNGFYPYIGSVRCCGARCEPDGANQAGQDLLFCGCPANGAPHLSICAWAARYAPGWNDGYESPPSPDQLMPLPRYFFASTALCQLYLNGCGCVTADPSWCSDRIECVPGSDPINSPQNCWNVGAAGGTCGYF